MFGSQPSFGTGSSLFGTTTTSTTPSFGGTTFGAPAAAPTSAFSFGAPTASAAPSMPTFGATTSTPAFGAPATAATPSLFGGGGSSLFGATSSAPAATTSLFGAAPAAAAPTSAPAAGGFPFSFGGGGAAAPAATTGSSAFPFMGTSNAPTFGGPTSTGSAFGATTTSTPGFGSFAGGPTGTTIAPYVAVTEKDPTNAAMVTIHNISAMKEYKDKSFDELRWEDYTLGRKGAVTSAPAGGSLFGSAAPAAAGGLFGGATTTPSAFSTTASAPLGGTSSLFSAPTTTTTGAGSLFGGGTATTGLFGSTPSTGTSLFGTTTAPSTGTSLFSATTTAPTTASSLFGTTSAPTFGATAPGAAPAASSSLFPSFSTATASAPSSSTFSFGATASPAASSSGSLFGAAAPSTSLFGAPSSAGDSSSLFGGTSSLFGGAAGTVSALGGGAGGATSSLFGGTSGTSLFGSSAPAATGGGLFSNISTTGTTAAGTGNLFGQSSLFGSTTPSTPATGTSSSFPALSFGGAPSLGTAPSFSSSMPLFGGIGATPTAGAVGAGTLVATVDSPRPYGSIPPLPSVESADAVLASAAQTKSAQKPKHYKLTSRSPATSRPISYYQTTPKRVSFMGDILKQKELQPGASALPSLTDDSSRRKLILEPDDNVPMPEVAEFNATPAVNQRSSALPPSTPYVAPLSEGEVKSDEKENAIMADRERLAVPSIQVTTPSGRAVGVSSRPSALYTSPQREALESTPKKPIVERRQGQVLDYSGDTPEAKRLVSNYDEFHRHLLGDQDKHKPSASPSRSVDDLLPTLVEPGYWMQPSREDLRHYTADQLASVDDFVVGREGYGRVEFLEPVDVRGIDINQVIKIEPTLVEVFPDDSRKPPHGQGLNVRARITIEQVWPERRDEKSLNNYEAYLKKVGRRRRQTFVKYDKQHGAWTFDVPHF